MPRASLTSPASSSPPRALGGALLLALSGLAAPLALASCGDDPLGQPTPGADAGADACVPADAPCTLELTYPDGGEQSVVLRGDFAPDGWDVGVPMVRSGGMWRTSVVVPDGTRVHYKFVINGDTWVTDPGNPDTEPDGLGGSNSVKTASCAAGPRCDQSDGGTVVGFDWRSAVMYFVFIDRFRNGDPANDAPVAGVEGPANYQGGDYAGLLQKINEGYFDDLGVNCLWLTVPMDNPSVAGAGADGHPYSAYHGYWPGDLTAVEEHFGDLALLKEVVQAAHDRGIKVLFDYAMNHVHSASPIYQQHPEWFWPLDYDGKHCVCGEGCDWNDPYDQKRCWFRDYLPDWNFTDSAARQFSVDNAIQWIEDTGIDGYRLDAVKHIETAWISDLRARTDALDAARGERFYMVGETFESGNRDVIKQYVAPALLDGQFDFPLRGVLVETVLRRTGSMADLDGFLASNDTYYDGVMSTFIGNHDLARVIHAALDQPWGAWDNGGSANWQNPPPLPDYRAPFERVALAFTFLFTTKGIPLVYYGDEIGMAGAGDPDNRRFMQWDNLTPDQAFLRDHLSRLGRIRKDHPALWKGTRTTASVSQDTYGYTLTDGADTVWVAMNRGDVTAAVGGMPSAGRDLLTEADVDGPSVTLPPRSAMILVER